MTNVLTLTQRIACARAGLAVNRCHTVRHTSHYNNGSHTAGMMMLMLQLWPKEFPRLAAYCLCHDIPEAWIGDIPSPVLKFMKGLRGSNNAAETRIFQELKLPNYLDLKTLDLEMLKNCDLMDLWLWCVEEQLAGNSFVRQMKREIENYVGPKGEKLLLETATVFREVKRLPELLLPIQAGVIENVCK